MYIVFWVFVIVFIGGLVGEIQNDYGYLSYWSAWIILVGFGGVLVFGLLWLFLWKGQRDDREKQTDEAYDKVEPAATVIDRNGNTVDTKWTELTKERMRLSEDPH